MNGYIDIAKQIGIPGLSHWGKVVTDEKCWAQPWEDLQMERMVKGQLLLTKQDIQL